jgi:hypothetical protein
LVLTAAAEEVAAANPATAVLGELFGECASKEADDRPTFSSCLGRLDGAVALMHPEVGRPGPKLLPGPELGLGPGRGGPKMLPAPEASSPAPEAGPTEEECNALSARPVPPADWLHFQSPLSRALAHATGLVIEEIPSGTRGDSGGSAEGGAQEPRPPPPPPPETKPAHVVLDDCGGNSS